VESRVLGRVFGRVVFAGFLGVMSGVQRVPMRDVRVVRGLDVILVVVMLRRAPVMLRCLFVVVCRLPVMVRAFVLRHVRLRRALRAASRGFRNDDSLVAVVGTLTFEASGGVGQPLFCHEGAVVA
jgi:hypothetical protein